MEPYDYEIYKRAYVKGYRTGRSTAKRKEEEQSKRPDSYYEDLIDIERD